MRPTSTFQAKDFPLFAGLLDSDYGFIESSGKQVTYARGQRVLIQGDDAKDIYLLHTGCVRVLISDPSGNQITVKLLMAPAVFGEMEALTETTFIESVETLTACQIFEVPAPAFERIMERIPVICRRLLRDVCLRWRTSAKNQGHMAFDPVEQRLAALILSYMAATGIGVADGIQLGAQDLTQDELARGIGATRKSIQRTLLRWQEQEIVVRQGKLLVVRRPDEIRNMAGDDPARMDHQLANSPPNT